MKKVCPAVWFLGICWTVALLGLAIAPGCTTTQQKTTYQTLGVLEQSSTAAVDGYYALVIRGTLPTNDVPRVTRAYNVFQAAIAVAIDGAAANTNALAPPSLVTLSQDLVNLVNTVTATATATNHTTTP